MTGRAEKAARWMMGRLLDDGVLPVGTAVEHVAATFGEGLVYRDANGSGALRLPVLLAFHALTGETVVWCVEERCWRDLYPFAA